MYLHLHHQLYLNLSMRKLIALCLIVFLVSCKDKDKDSTVEPDYAPEFVGIYTTTTVNGIETTVQEWDITNTDKNVLAINYTKSIKVSTSGTTLTAVQIWKIKDAKVTAADSFTLDEVIDVEQTTPGKLTQKLQGTAMKVTNAAGVNQLNITIKFTNAGDSKVTEDYLEFKKK